MIEDGPVPELTYSFQILATPDEETEEADGVIDCLQANGSRELRIEGPITYSTWERAVNAAEEVFLRILDEELSEEEGD